MALEATAARELADTVAMKRRLVKSFVFISKLYKFKTIYDYFY